MYNPLKNRYFVWIAILIQACTAKSIPPWVLATPFQLIQPFKANHLTIHAAIKLQAVSKEYKLRLQWRIQKHKLIWVSIATTWGLEVARARITPKYLELINHVTRTYSIYDYASLQAKWRCPFTYDFLEAILLGELPNDFTHLEEKKVHEYTIIHKKNSAWYLKASIKNSIGKIEHWDLVNSLTRDRCSAYYQEFQPHPPGLLFKHADLYTDHMIIHMTYTRIQWSKRKFKFPFRIPTTYAKL